LISIGKKEGLEGIEGEILRDNRAMQMIARLKWGFLSIKLPILSKRNLNYEAFLTS
jgi:acetyltransferase